MLNRILFGGEPDGSFAANAGIALVRIFAGVALAFGHGINKFPPSAQFIEGAGELGFPAPGLFSWMAAISEFGGGLCLALGLFTRISSFLIACTMFTAAFVAHAADPFQRKELALLYLVIAIAFFLKGAGDWSVDRFFRKGS